MLILFGGKDNILIKFATMFSIFLLLFLALSAALIIYPFKNGKRGFWTKIFRIFVVLISVGVFAYFFITKSLTRFTKDAMTVQIINKMPLPLDVYLVKINQDDDAQKGYETRHVGTIRTNHFRMEYLDIKKSDEFWIAALQGKNNMVYFSQHSLANKNEDRNIEIQTYLNQSEKLSAIAKEKIEDLKIENSKSAIWIVLDLLLLFLNIVLLFKKRKLDTSV